MNVLCKAMSQIKPKFKLHYFSLISRSIRDQPSIYFKLGDFQPTRPANAKTVLNPAPAVKQPRKRPAPRPKTPPPTVQVTFLVFLSWCTIKVDEYKSYFYGRKIKFLLRIFYVVFYQFFKLQTFCFVFQEVESKRSRKTVSQFQSPIPDIQQIMKKIQDKETGEKEKKPKETNPTVFFK